MRETEVNDPDNPEWTDDDFQRARPAGEVHGHEFAAQLVRQPTGIGSLLAGQQTWLRNEKLAA